MPGSPFSVAGVTVGEALESVVGGQLQVRFYVLDERGAFRKRVIRAGERLGTTCARRCSIINAHLPPIYAVRFANQRRH